jgi:hypothetical protein
LGLDAVLNQQEVGDGQKRGSVANDEQRPEYENPSSVRVDMISIRSYAFRSLTGEYRIASSVLFEC